jgi:FkbM family methyltransferase
MGESINKVTVVSALFYIGRDRWKHSGFPPGVDRYKSWVTNLLRQDINLYFYADDYYYDFILENRKKYDPNFEKTVLIKTSLDELYFYKQYYNQEACLMASPDFRKTVFQQGSADMNYPLYHVVNFGKIELVKKSFEENKFQSDYFFWVDAGGLRNVISETSSTWLDSNNTCFNTDKITHFSHREDFSIGPDKSDYFRSQTRNIQGTAWIVPKEKINSFYNLIDEQVATIIKERIVGSDEKVYDYIYLNNKELFRLEVCGWFEFYNIVRQTSKTVEGQDNVQSGKNIFVDMGAHEQQGLGQFIPMLAIDTSWEIHCFEPNNILSLENRFPDLNVTMHNKAVWKEDGIIHLNLYGADRKSQGSIVVGSEGSSVLIDLYDVIKVPSIDAYEFLKTFDENDSIYIKMDIEWSEYDVLEHMLDKGWLKNIKGIWVEWHGLQYETCTTRKEAIVGRAKEHGIEIQNWY